MTSQPRAEQGATRVSIVGLGAIGGSAALRLIERGVTPTGYSTDAADRDLAAAAGIRVVESIDAAVTDADLVFIAVPLDQLGVVADAVVSTAPADATILHGAGLQRRDATGFQERIASRVIGSHPMAGSERSGFGAASAGMFSGATVLVEDTASKRVREDVELFWSMAGARRIEYLSAMEHDDLVAATSHVPQLVATALAATLAYASVPGGSLGPGGRDMTRLAASPWSMWKPLLQATPGRTLAMLESIENELREVREEMLRGSLDNTAVSWTVARDWALERRASTSADR